MKVDDVTVGEVTDVERVGWHARVTLRIRDDVELPDNAVAEIRQVSLLGEKYVALEAPATGAEGRLSDGDDIPLSDTGRNPEVEEVLGALSFLLSGGGVAQLGTITQELNDGDGRAHRPAPPPARLARRRRRDASTTQKADIITAMAVARPPDRDAERREEHDHRVPSTSWAPPCTCSPRSTTS